MDADQNLGLLWDGSFTSLTSSTSGGPYRLRINAFTSASAYNRKLKLVAFIALLENAAAVLARRSDGSSTAEQTTSASGSMQWRAA